MSTLANPPAAGSRRNWRLAALLVLAGIIAVGLYPLGRYVYADVHYQRALSAAERRDFDTARRHFDVCVSEWPTSAEVRFNAARAARRAGDLEAAARLIREAKKLGWVQEAIDLELALIDVQQRNHRSLAPALLDLVRRGHPDSVLILEALTPAAMADFEVDVVWQCVDPWIAAAPNDERPRLIKGELLERLRSRNDAIALYREAVKLAPENPEARLRCGWLALEMKSTEEAAGHFEWLLKRKPQDAEIRRATAKVRQAQGLPDEARQILDVLLKENPDDVEAMAARGELEMAAQKPEAAEKYLRPAAARSANELRILHQWQQCLNQLGREKESAEVGERIKRAEADQKKLAELRKELALKPHDAGIRLNIGQILMRNGLEREGRRWLESALADDPLHVETHKAMAEYYDREGKRERADAHRRAAAAGEKKQK